MADWHFSPIGKDAKAPLAVGNPFGFAWENDKSQHVVYRGKDNQIHELWFKHGYVMSGAWQHAPIGQQAGAPAAAGDPVAYCWEHDKSQHVIYRGADNMIHELWFKHGTVMSGSWQHAAIGKDAGAPPAASDPIAYCWEGDGSQHVVYVGMDGQIHELWFKHGTVMSGSWQHAAIGKDAGAPAAAKAKPTAFAWEDDKSQHIIYSGTDNKLHELWFKHGYVVSGSWQHKNITDEAKAPKVAGDICAFPWEGDESQHVAFCTDNGAVHELWYKHGSVMSGSWAYSTVSESKAPAADGRPWGFAWENDSSQHIVYRGEDKQIHELWFKHGYVMSGAWQHNAIGKVTGAPPASSDPCGYTWEGDGSQHVLYVALDGMIYELWQKK